ncbi:MAG: FG-GAP-like repeat-containing protein [Isosphaerales bacterium]
MRRRVLILVLGFGIVLAGWIAVQAVGAWRLRTELAEARRLIGARRFGEARVRLARVEKRWPMRGDVEYWLGLCEEIEGRTDAAMAAWGRVPALAREGPMAALARGRLALETGRYALAESCLERANRAGGETGDEGGRLLGRLHWITGRHDDYQRFLRREVERQRNPSETLRMIWSIETVAYPIDAMREALENARRAAPDDDRVWLALADLATRSGRFEEAGEWLTRCERARPDDHAVWRARLEWARAADRPEEVVRASAHLPASSFSKARVLGLRAWLAARNGDRRAERSAIEEVLALEPEDSSALERLADLAAQAGETNRVAGLRRRKAAVDVASERYRTLASLPDLAPHAAELATAALALGRRFDARAWWGLVARQDPAAATEAQAAIALLTPAEPAPDSDGRSLADLVTPPAPRWEGKAAVASALGVPSFIDDAEQSGLTLVFDNGRTDRRQLPETMSGGVAVLDFDGDGRLDIYAVQGGPFPPRTNPPPFGDRLFRNRGDGRFEDVTAASGLATLAGGYGHGVAVGDYDNDGRPDLFVTRWGSYALYHNLGQGRFEDVTDRAALSGVRDWPTSAAWADLDNDGDLDLYVCHYLKWDPATAPPCEDPPRPGYTYCDPRHFPALPDHVFRNDGGRFVDVTEQAGIVDLDGRGLGVLAADLDGDGKTDLFVANDTTANYFFRNQGGFRFTEEGHESGLATNASGGYLAGMGVACGDFDGDGRLDLAVTNFYGESTTLYHNLGGGLFSDRTSAAGLVAPTRFVLGFGLAAIDANNDGHLDLVQANGHTNDYRPTTPYAMPAQLFLGDGAGKLFDVSSRAGPPWQQLRLGRGLATGDLDNDGRTDLLIVSENAPLALFRNQAASLDHFLTLAVEGTASNRDGVGARVAVTVSGRTQVAARFGGGSYLSANDHRLHFGLGAARMVDRVEVTWPSGGRDRYQGLAADAGYRLREGDPIPKPLAGFAARAADR